MATKAANGRRLAASGALIATAAGIAAVGLHDPRWIQWSLVASAGVLGIAGVGLAQRSMPGQIFSRAAAWLVLVPAALVTVVSTLIGHHPDLTGAALTAGSGAALLLARPMLHTPEALADFAPSRFRSWLLAGATASTATGMLVSLIGLDVVYEAWRGYGSSSYYAVAPALLVLGAALAASAYGVIRLRTWGILLGALTSLVTLTAAAFMRDAAGLALSLAALPGLLFFVLPVLIAQRERARDARADRGGRVRIASDDVTARVPARVRVAIDEHASFREALGAQDEGSAAAPAARVQHVGRA